jgi:CheY-like chemotaxis protein
VPKYEELVAHLRTALPHLDDPAYLENHPLVKQIGFIAQAQDLSRGQMLRRTLRLAIEALDPGPGVSPNSPEARAYEVLSRRYVSKQNILAIAAGLDLSDRQAYRELRRAMVAMAVILSRFMTDTKGEIQGPKEENNLGSDLNKEVARLSAASLRQLELGHLVTAVIESIQFLASDRGITLQLLNEASLTNVTTNRVMLRQALLNLLSHAVRVHREDNLTIHLYNSAQEVCIQFGYHSLSEEEASYPAEPYAVAGQLLDHLGIRWTRTDSEEGITQISVAIPVIDRRVRAVLLIDDNEGLIALFKRYLQHQPFRVFSAGSFRDAMAQLDEVQPDVVILDIMMPERDGWEILQALHIKTMSHRPRLIVCSIINDPDLSAALGADAFLHKPVDQASLLQTITRVLGEGT